MEFFFNHTSLTHHCTIVNNRIVDNIIHLCYSIINITKWKDQVPMLDFDIQKIERKNLTDQVVAALRVMMFSGQVPAGRRLIETDLANKLGVGRGSLREALRKLEGEGLVESIPGRGTYIASLSERDIQEVFSLRLVLETAAISLAIKNATPEQFDKLQETLDIMMETARLGDAVAVVELDLKFHRQIWEMADHQRMKNVLEGLLSQLRDLFGRVCPPAGLHGSRD